MSKLALLFAAFCVSLWTTPVSGRTPEPSFPETVRLSDSDESLQKLGEYRYVYRYLFKLYDVALYAPGGAAPDDILDAAVPFRLQFRYLREIEKAIILKSADRMLEKNLTEAERAKIAKQIETIHTAYQTVRDGDRSSLTFHPNRGTTLRIGDEAVATIEGRDFARL